MTLPINPLPFHVPGCYLAGGSILSIVTNTEINDYDIYPKSKKDIVNILDILIHDESCFIMNISERAITLKSNNHKNSEGKRVFIQLMTFTDFTSPDVIFDTFDFTVCMGAYDTDTKQYIFHPSFYPDVASRTLNFNTKTKYPLNSLLRVKKYQEKGYTISKSEMVKIALTIAQKNNIASWKDLENEIGGSYGRQLSLNAGDLKYTFDNAINVLTNLDMNQCQNDQSHLYENVNRDPELLQMFLDPEDEVEYITIGNDIFLVRNQHIKEKLPQILIDIFRPINFKEYQGRLFGYKDLLEKDDILYPSVRTYDNNGVTYKLNQETQWDKDPYLFVYKSKCVDTCYFRNSAQYKVSFDSDDIKQFNINEVQVTKLKIEERIV